MEEGKEYLESLLNQQLRVYTTDGRMFMGYFKCTDNECNIILSTAYEYRQPTKQALETAMAEAARRGETNFKADMTSRLMGLIVLPGQHITKIEVDE